MKKLFRLLIAVLALLISSSIFADQYSWSGYQKDAQHEGFANTDLNFQSSKVIWKKMLGSGLNPVVANNSTVFATTRNSIQALDIQTGNILWAKTFQNVDSINPPSINDKSVFFQTIGNDQSSYLQAFGINQGNELFKTQYTSQWSHYFAPANFQNNVYTPCGYTSGICAYNASTGKLLWSHGLTFFENWTPTVTKKYVIALTDVLSVFDRSSGTLVFTFGTPYPYSSVWDQNGAAIVGSLNDVIYDHADDGLNPRKNKLYSVSLKTHQANWVINGQFYGQPVLANGIVYVNNNGKITAYSEVNGRFLWSWQADLNANSNNYHLLVTNNVLIVSSDLQTAAINLETHQKVWSYNIGGDITLVGDKLLFANNNGSLTALSVNSSNPNPTIDEMDTGTLYTDTYSPGKPMDIFAFAASYHLNDGTSWNSGAGSQNNKQMTFVREYTDTHGNFHYFFKGANTQGLIFQNTDYDSGKHSAQGSLGDTGLLELIAKPNSDTATLAGLAKVVSNKMTSYGIPRFNYYSAKVGSFVPFEMNFTLSSGIWTANIFQTTFQYKVSGKVIFAAKKMSSLLQRISLNLGTTSKRYQSQR